MTLKGGMQTMPYSLLHM